MGSRKTKSSLRYLGTLIGISTNTSTLGSVFDSEDSFDKHFSKSKVNCYPASLTHRPSCEARAPILWPKPCAAAETANLCLATELSLQDTGCAELHWALVWELEQKSPKNSI